MIASLGCCTAMAADEPPTRGATGGGLGDEAVVESAVRLPVAYDVDVLVVGGSLAGVEAACSAAKNGADVLLIDARPYLGYDLCATQRLWLERGEKPQTALTRSIFGAGSVATPMRVKTAMDKAVLEAGADFLTGCYAIDVLFAGGSSSPAGVVMVNRSGRQIIRAKVIIDATDQAAMTRGTAAAFRPFVAGLERSITWWSAATGPGRAGARTPGHLHVREAGRSIPVYEYSLTIDLADAGFASLSKAFHKARSLTWTNGAVDDSELLFHSRRIRRVGR